MHSLYLKIFLWFWLAIALVAVALVVTMTWTDSDSAARWRNVTVSALEMYAQTAVETFEKRGSEALGEYLDGIEREAQIRAFVFDEKGAEVSGRDASPAIRELAAQARQSREVEFRFTGTSPLAAKRVRSARGKSYILVGEMQFNPLALFTADFRTQALRLLVVLLTAGIVCFWLARYVSSPVVKLRAATQRLAEGDLSTRIGEKLGGRRDELAQLGRDFDLMAERIESLMLAQRRLLGDISHELRSPLTRLSLALEIARGRAGSEAATALDRIELETERLNQMIGELLALTRLESGVEPKSDNLIDLAQLVDEIAEDADFEAQSRNRSVRVVHTSPVTTRGNQELLRSAVENIVRNAVRHTDENTEVEIALRCEPSSGNSDDSQAVISVRDYGSGVPEEALGDIFQPFYRVADARDRQSGGAGLGLAIAERAVKLQGGTVTAVNAADGGLRVEICLPCST